MALLEKVSLDHLLEEVLDFLLDNPSLEAIASYQLPEPLQSYTSDLLARNKQGRLSQHDNAELDEILRVNHVLSLLKTRARMRMLDS